MGALGPLDLCCASNLFSRMMKKRRVDAPIIDFSAIELIDTIQAAPKLDLK